MQAQLIPIEKIAESPTNPRRRTSPEKDAELVESVRAQGVLQPVLVRPRPTVDAVMELVFGHRRLRAAREVGLTEIPALIRSLTDEEAADAQAAENGPREDLHPLDEAESYARLRGFGRTVEEIAARVGKSHVHVARRLRLLELEEPVRKLLEEGKLDAARALLCAAIAHPKHQVEAAKEMAQGDWRGEAWSLNECRRIAQRYMLSLAKTPWALDDAALVPEAGACLSCPKRTGAQGALFDAGTDAEDLCTDQACFEGKKKAHAQVLLDKAKAGGARLLPAKDAKELTDYGGTPKGYRRLDQSCIEDPKRRTYRQLLKKAEFERVVAKSKGGDVVELVAEKGLAAALRAAGHDFKKQRASAVGTARRTMTTKQSGKEAVRDEQLRREFDAVWEGARGHGDSAELLRLVVAEAESMWDEPERMYALLGIEPTKSREEERKRIQAWIAQASAHDLLAALVLGDVVRLAWRGQVPDPVAKALGIDRKKIAAGLKADLAKLAAAAKKAAPKAAKKAPAKKARAAKATPKKRAKAKA